MYMCMLIGVTCIRVHVCICMYVCMSVLCVDVCVHLTAATEHVS